MNIDIFTKNITLDEPLHVFVEEKMNDLEHLLGSAGPASVKVEIGKATRHHRKGDVFYAEANLLIGGTLLRASCSHEDLRNAITDVKNELQVQIKKHKEKSKGL